MTDPETSESDPEPAAETSESDPGPAAVTSESDPGPAAVTSESDPGPAAVTSDPDPAPAPADVATGEPEHTTRVDTVRAAGVDIHPPTSLERGSYAFVRGLFILLAKPYFRLEVRGAENVPAHGPFVLSPVHRSNLDFILASTVRRGRMRYMGKASIWKSRLLGRFVSMLGAFPVHRGTADRESVRTCLEVIENGEPLVMFPEGTRKSGPKVAEIFDGTAYVAARAGVPIVPVGIGGSDEAMPVGAKMIKPHKVVVIVGKPITPPPGDGTGRVKRRVVREMTAQLQSDLQALYDEARRLAE